MNSSNAKDYLPLVQALAEGRGIQHRFDGEAWYDRDNFDFTDKADNYRIKPEPREVWVNEYATGKSIAHFTETSARASALPDAVTRRYREVIE